MASSSLLSASSALRGGGGGGGLLRFAVAATSTSSFSSTAATPIESVSFASRSSSTSSSRCRFPLVASPPTSLSSRALPVSHASSSSLSSPLNTIAMPTTTTAVIGKSSTAALLLLPPRVGGFAFRSFSSAAAAPPPKDTASSPPGGKGEKDVVDHHDHHHAAEPKGLYNVPDHHHHHGDGREHLWPDGTRKWNYTTDGFHWDDAYTNVPKQDIVMVNGQKMIKGVETRPLEQLFLVSQANMPFWPRTRLNFWGNYPLVLKAEFLFFWIPTLIIWSLCIPIFTLLYMQDEAIYTTMTVKVIGRQWYWVYEVESPPADD